jgi:hypothetical protein
MMIKAVESLSSFPPNANPYVHDAYHMGTEIANDLHVMFTAFEGNKYIILIHKITGERVKVWFDISAWKKMDDFNADNYYNWEGEASIPILQKKVR